MNERGLQADDKRLLVSWIQEKHDDDSWMGRIRPGEEA